MASRAGMRVRVMCSMRCASGPRCGAEAVVVPAPNLSQSLAYSLRAHGLHVYSVTPSPLYCAVQPAVFQRSGGFALTGTDVTDVVAG